MKLRRNERDYYMAEITSDPSLAGAWEAAFNGGTAYVEGVNTEGNIWAWLVAGPDFNAAAVGMEDADTMATITETCVPKLRNKDNPVLDAEDGPRITLTD